MATNIVSAGTVTNSTGRGMQNHLIYAVNSARWWIFYIDSTDGATLKTRYSTDLLSWSSGASLTLAQNHNSVGLNFAVAYKNIASTDVIHIAFSYQLSTTDRRSYHTRATISGTTISFGSEVQVGSTNTDSDSNASPDGPNLGYDSDNKIWHACGWDYVGDWNCEVDARSTNADTGSSWTGGFDTPTRRETTPGGYVRTRVLADIGSGNMLVVWGNGTGAGAGWDNLRWAKWTTSWSSPANVRGTSFGSPLLHNNWGMVTRAATDVHIVMRTGADTYEHFRFDGSAWSTGQAITTQTSKDDAGIFLASDGTNVWLFIIDSDAANTIRYSKWNGSSWGSWVVLETVTGARTFISGYFGVSNNKIGIIYSQVNGSNYDIYSTSLTTVIDTSVPTNSPGLTSLLLGLASDAGTQTNYQVDSTYTFGTSGEAVFCRFLSPVSQTSGNLTFYPYCSAIAGSPMYKVELRNGPASGNDADRPESGGAQLAVSASDVVPSASSWIQFALTGVTLVAGQQYYLVIYNTAAAPTTDYASWCYRGAVDGHNTTSTSASTSPMQAGYTTDGFTTDPLGVVTNQLSPMVIKFNDSSIIGMPYVATETIANNANYRGNRIYLPQSTIYFGHSIVATFVAATTWNNRIYNGASLIKDIVVDTFGRQRFGGTIDGDVTLSANTYYDIVAVPGAANSWGYAYNMGMAEGSVPADVLAARPQGLIGYVNGATPGSFTPDTSKIMAQLIYLAFATEAGGGGPVSGNMRGGFING